jgi:hypothetical protein
MNLMKRIVAALAVMGAVTASAGAQVPRKLDISFDNGKVTLVAENVTLREILAEWARKGGSRIVNAEKLGGNPVYLTEFKNEPEAMVLRTLLRDAPGYGVALRTDATAGTSTIGTVMILANRTVPISNSSVSAPQVSPQPPPQPQPAPRLIQGSPDDEIPPVQQIGGNMPPSTPGSPASNNSNLRTGQNGIVTSTVPGVVIPGPPVDPGRGGGRGNIGGGPPTLPPGRGGGRGGGGGR